MGSRWCTNNGKKAESEMPDTSDSQQLVNIGYVQYLKGRDHKPIFKFVRMVDEETAAVRTVVNTAQKNLHLHTLQVAVCQMRSNVVVSRLKHSKYETTDWSYCI